AVGGSAVYEASRKVLAKARQFAAHTLGAAAVADVGYGAGVFTGPEREDGGPASSVTWQDVARLAHFVPDIPPGLEPGLDERVFYDPRGLTFPFATYLALVQVDPPTRHILLHPFLPLHHP